MRPWLLLATAVSLIAVGLGMIYEAVASGQAHFALFVIVPVVYGSSLFLALGSFLLLGGTLLLFLSSMGRASWESEEPESELPSAYADAREGGEPTESNGSFGGFLLIGPVPIAFGNRQGMRPYVVLMGLILIVALVLFVLLL
jgi:uncharacterized protein (TIGR00304 family)